METKTAEISTKEVVSKVEKGLKMEKEEDIKQQQQNQRLPQEIKNLIAGGLAGMVAKTVVAPIDRIKILYQVTSAPFHLSDIPNVISRIIREEGFIALWKGNTATMIRVFPYAGIQFMVFNKCKSHLISLHDENNNDDGRSFNNGSGIGDIDVQSQDLASVKNNEQMKKDHKWDLSPIESLLAGATAGAVSVIFTYPLDLSRAQLAVLKRKKSIRSDGFFNVLTGNYTKWVCLFD